jgi:hypothetical protein
MFAPWWQWLAEDESAWVDSWISHGLAVRSVRAPSSHVSSTLFMLCGSMEVHGVHAPCQYVHATAAAGFPGRHAIYMHVHLSCTIQ